MGFAFVPLYIKYLGIEAYGLIGLFAVLQAWLALLDMGLTPTLSREMARLTGGEHSAVSIRDLLRSVEVVALIVAVLMAGAIALISTWLASTWVRAENLDGHVVAKAFAIMGVVAALRFVEGIYRSSLVGLQQQVMFNVINSGMATLRSLGAVVVLAWMSPTILAFFVWQGLGSVLTLALLALATYARLPRSERSGRFSLETLRKVWRFAGGMTGITFLALLLTQVDKILLSKLLSLSDYGYYTLAAAVAGILLMLITPITQAWFPRLSQLQAVDDTDAFVHSYHQGAQLISVTLGSAAIVLIMFSEVFLQLWTQDIVLAQRAARLLSLLALGNLLNGLMWIPYQAQLAYGWTGLTVRINIVAVLIIVPAILWATSRYGAEGAAWAWVSLNAGYVFFGIHFMCRRILLKEKWRWYIQDTIQPLLASAVVGVGVRWIMSPSIGLYEQLAWLLFASILTFTAAGFAAEQVRRDIILFLNRMALFRLKK